MVGQDRLLDVIYTQIERYDDFPRFSIIFGAEGSGKKTLAQSIAVALNCGLARVDIKIDAIREMIRTCYTVQEPTVYLIADADKMSVSAKNAMLKICEETPKNAYIIMTVCDESTVLNTISSRAGKYFMQPYTPNEILQYYDEVSNNDATKIYAITDLCETPGDVNKLLDVGVDDFYNYVEKVVDNIALTSSANAFKIANEIDFKGGEGYDMVLFLRAFRSICGRELRRCIAEKSDIVEREHYSAGIRIASTALTNAKITGINKSALFDMFILDIRREWCE